MNAREAAKRTLTGKALRRSLVVALVVGTALNLINQGPEMLSGKWPVLWKLALTYVVPWSRAMAAMRRSEAPPEVRFHAHSKLEE